MRCRHLPRPPGPAARSRPVAAGQRPPAGEGRGASEGSRSFPSGARRGLPGISASSRAVSAGACPRSLAPNGTGSVCGGAQSSPSCAQLSAGAVAVAVPPRRRGATV